MKACRRTCTSTAYFYIPLQRYVTVFVHTLLFTLNLLVNYFRSVLFQSIFYSRWAYKHTVKERLIEDSVQFRLNAFCQTEILFAFHYPLCASVYATNRRWMTKSTKDGKLEGNWTKKWNKRKRGSDKDRERQRKKDTIMFHPSSPPSLQLTCRMCAGVMIAAQNNDCV